MSCGASRRQRIDPRRQPETGSPYLPVLVVVLLAARAHVGVHRQERAAAEAQVVDVQELPAGAKAALCRGGAAPSRLVRGVVLLLMLPPQLSRPWIVHPMMPDYLRIIYV